MSLSKCKGDAAKSSILSSYNIKPIMYIRLLAGQKINGCCGPIKDKYYLFEAVDKTNNKIENFSVGYDCGNQFLTLINHPSISLFNPFTSPRGQTGGGGGTNGNPVQMHGLNREFKDAIHILCSAWGYVPKGNMRLNLEYINNMPQRPTNASSIIKFNKTVGKDAKGRALSAIIADIRTKNPTLRNFSFPLMEAVLLNANEKSNL
jgi:hypothetical protein